MPSLPPEGEQPPSDGSLPPSALSSVGTRPFGIYLHVPFCNTRCGYCDFNTYTATELSGDVRRDTFGEVLQSEVAFAREITGPVEVDTVFVGGGTPTLLGAESLVRLLDEIRGQYGLAAGAEVTTEANPDTVDQAMLDRLRAGGYTRISFGVQSAASSVLRILERTHTAGNAQRAIAMARAAGFEHVSADLIIGTPGETDEDLEASLDLVVGSGVDHVSAYSLIVEAGTPLARRVQRGEIPVPDDDTAAHRYEMVDDALAASGFAWYEVSNWARPGGECRHNVNYWASHDWWGVGPGAHSHIGGVRWWNERHPSTYAARLAGGHSPAQGRERLTPDQQHMETVMLALRMASGLPISAVPATGHSPVEVEREGERGVEGGLGSAVGTGSVIARLADEGLVDPHAAAAGVLVLTRRGRLLADAVIRDLLD